MSSHSNYLGAKKCCASNLAKTVIGPQGPQGSGGPIGPFGNQGATGTQGAKGATGLGCRGYQGFTGAQGVPGSPGGAQGDTGSQGATGPSQWTNMNGLGLSGIGYTGIGITGQDVLIYGNLLVTGGIDPTYLALTPQATGPQGLFNPLWLDSVNGNALRSNNIYLDSEPDPSYISLKPDNNTSQITLSDGITKTMRIKYDSITLNNGILNSSTINLDNSNNLQITSSDNIEITCNTGGTGGTISFNGGTALIADSAGVASGKFLVLTINGTPYKLPLFNI